MVNKFNINSQHILINSEYSQTVKEFHINSLQIFLKSKFSQTDNEFHINSQAMARGQMGQLSQVRNLTVNLH